MGIDGTWWRECYIEVISQSGAKITVEGSVENLKLNEFFLMLSTVGNAHRKCELVYVKGDEIGVRFLQKEVWPDYRGSAKDVLEVEIFQHWLEPA